jgi:hypothetical protein
MTVFKNSNRNKSIVISFLCIVIGFCTAFFNHKTVTLPIVPLAFLLLMAPFGVLVFLAFFFQKKETVTVGIGENKKQDAGYADSVMEIDPEGQIRGWSDVFGAPIRVRPGRPSNDRIVLSFNLIKEEVSELEGNVFEIDQDEKDRRFCMKALGSVWHEMPQEEKNHIIEAYQTLFPNREVKEKQLPVKQYLNLKSIADDLGDVLWVTYRKFMEYGLDPKQVINHIYEANMTKLCDSEEIAIDTVMHYSNMGIVAEYYQKGDKYVVYNPKTMKVLKSIKWQEPDFAFLGNEVESLTDPDAPSSAGLQVDEEWEAQPIDAVATQEEAEKDAGV